MENLPPEVLLQIFSYLYQEEIMQCSLNDLLNCELVCKRWKEIMNHSLWKELCRTLQRHHLKLSRRYSDLTPTFIQHQIEYGENFKIFYLKLLQLNLKWDIAKASDSKKIYSPKVTTIDTSLVEDIKANEDGSSSAKKLKISEQWRKQHNYSGIYDMVYVKEKCLLIASVDNTIQVWDVSGKKNSSTYKCINVISATVLDYDKDENMIDMVSCFYVSETADSLICGTHNSKLKVFDLNIPGGRLVDKYYVNGQSEFHGDNLKRNFTGNGFIKKTLYVSDLRIRRNHLIAIDWYGGIHEWNIISRTKRNEINEHSEHLIHLRSFTPNFGPMRDEWEDVMKTWWHSVQYTYNKRFSERLLDFSDDAILITKDKLMCVLPRENDLFDKSSVWIETNHPILCCKLLPMPQNESNKKEYCNNQIVILCGQQQGILLKYTFDERLFSSPTSGGYTYMKPHNPHIVAVPGTPVTSARHSILFTDFLAKSSNGPLASLHVFQSCYKSSITSLTPTFLPTLKNKRSDIQYCLIVVGDKDGELYFLDALTLKIKFHIGFPHANLTAYDEITQDILTSTDTSIYKQGVTFDIRGRIPEPVEQDSIIWAVATDSTRVFSGDSNGKLVIHDFWK